MLVCNERQSYPCMGRGAPSISRFEDCVLLNPKPLGLLSIIFGFIIRIYLPLTLSTSLPAVPSVPFHAIRRSYRQASRWHSIENHQPVGLDGGCFFLVHMLAQTFRYYFFFPTCKKRRAKMNIVNWHLVYEVNGKARRKASMYTFLKVEDEQEERHTHRHR